eukprot:950432_1
MYFVLSIITLVATFSALFAAPPPPPKLSFWDTWASIEYTIEQHEHDRGYDGTTQDVVGLAWVDHGAKKEYRYHQTIHTITGSAGGYKLDHWFTLNDVTTKLHTPESIKQINDEIKNAWERGIVITLTKPKEATKEVKKREIEEIELPSRIVIKGCVIRHPRRVPEKPMEPSAFLQIKDQMLPSGTYRMYKIDNEEVIKIGYDCYAYRCGEYG